jgi:SAM-dependent methyltransferase
MSGQTLISNRTYDAAFAAYFDRLTSHKDYGAEVDALVRFIRQMTPRPDPRILDVGCGTGTHAALLADRGYDVTAIDLAPDMVRQAQAKTRALKVVCGDISELPDSGFSVCVSLFNVVNYIESLEALVAFFVEVAERLSDGGVFVVETWNPVAVIAVPPAVVERIFDDEGRSIRRTVVPHPDFLRQRLDLRYDIEVEGAESFSVTHKLVLFTPLEIEFALRRAGFGKIEVRTALPDLAAAGAHDRMLAFSCERTGTPRRL